MADQPYDAPEGFHWSRGGDIPLLIRNATFRERFNANPLGSFAVMRQSKNVEDDRQHSLPRAVAAVQQNLVDNVKDYLQRGASRLGLGEESALEPTDDPLAKQAGYNDIKVQKVIHPSWWTNEGKFGFPKRPQRFAGGQDPGVEMADRMEDIHSEVDPTRSDMDRNVVDPLSNRYRQGAQQTVPVENNADVDPIARPPGTVERQEDIDL